MNLHLRRIVTGHHLCKIKVQIWTEGFERQPAIAKTLQPPAYNARIRSPARLGFAVFERVRAKCIPAGTDD